MADTSLVKKVLADTKIWQAISKVEAGGVDYNPKTGKIIINYEVGHMLRKTYNATRPAPDAAGEKAYREQVLANIVFNSAKDSNSNYARRDASDKAKTASQLVQIFPNIEANGSKGIFQLKPFSIKTAYGSENQPGGEIYAVAPQSVSAPCFKAHYSYNKYNALFYSGIGGNQVTFCNNKNLLSRVAKLFEGAAMSSDKTIWTDLREYWCSSALNDAMHALLNRNWTKIGKYFNGGSDGVTYGSHVKAAYEKLFGPYKAGESQEIITLEAVTETEKKNTKTKVITTATLTGTDKFILSDTSRLTEIGSLTDEQAIALGIIYVDSRFLSN